MSDFHFPKDFMWGVATSAYQIEGAPLEDGRGPSIWDTFCRLPGVISDNSSGDVACDHFHRLEQDLDLIAELGLQAYRFSVSWSRIQPEGKGPCNLKGLGFYERLVDGLLKRNITPFLTLYHWDLPQALQDKGGWPSRDTAHYFADYAAIIAQRLGDRVRHFVTHNEPWIVAMLGYQSGIFAPGVKDRKLAAQASHHLLLSHGLAVHVMRQSIKQLDIGIALNLAPFHPQTEKPEDLAQAKLEDGMLLRWYMDPLFRGEYPADILEHLGDDAPKVAPGDFDAIRAPIDFLGMNYYSRVPIGIPDTHAPEPEAFGTTEMGWEVYPAGMIELATRIKREYNPPAIIITENGAAYADVVNDGHVHDRMRTEYLKLHTAALATSIAAGVNIRGYFVWSLFDNFEWAFGYTKRFGIVYIDYKTQKRILKDSALWYRDFIASQRRGR